MKKIDPEWPNLTKIITISLLEALDWNAEGLRNTFRLYGDMQASLFEMVKKLWTGRRKIKKNIYIWFTNKRHTLITAALEHGKS